MVRLNRPVPTGQAKHTGQGQRFQLGLSQAGLGSTFSQICDTDGMREEGKKKKSSLVRTCLQRRDGWMDGGLCEWMSVGASGLLLCPSLDELGGVSLAYEHLQQPELGFDVLVFIVLLCQRRAVFLLYVSMGTRGGREEKTTNIRKWPTLRNAGNLLQPSHEALRQSVLKCQDVNTI